MSVRCNIPYLTHVHFPFFPCALMTLGDAVYGFLVVRYFFQSFKNLTPGIIADMKDAAVSNAFLARVSMHLDLSSHMDHYSEPLKQAILAYENRILDKEAVVERRGSRRHRKPGAAPPLSQLTHPSFAEGCNFRYWEFISPPKSVSDIYEALLGSVFVDSRFDVEAVWNVVVRTCLPWITHYVLPMMVKSDVIYDLTQFVKDTYSCRNIVLR